MKLNKSDFLQANYENQRLYLLHIFEQIDTNSIYEDMIFFLSNSLASQERLLQIFDTLDSILHTHDTEEIDNQHHILADIITQSEQEHDSESQEADHLLNTI